MAHGTEGSPLTQLLQHVDAVAEGVAPADAISTGFPSVDKLLGGGLRRGDLIVLGGDVGSGKSALALAIALRAQESGARVAFLSGEMTAARVVERALAISARAKVDDLRHGALGDENRSALGLAAIRLRDQLPVIVVIPAAQPGVQPPLLDGDDLDVLVVDSLQSLPSGTGAWGDELAAAIRSLKALAMERDVAVLVTAHLSAQVRERQDARPILDDFGAFGAVKQQADIVLALYREEMYNPDQLSEGATELAVLKNRNGPNDYVDLYFYKQWLRFEDMVDPDR